MDEFLIPSIYDGDSSGISVMFAGLNNENYESLELSIDGENFVSVERGTGNPFYSSAYTFNNLENNKMYCVKGKFVSDGICHCIQCNFPAQTAIKQELLNYSTYQSGGISNPPEPPSARVLYGNC